MATCPTCATPLPADARFCPKCGATTPTGISQETGRTTLSAPTVSTAEAVLARRAEVQRALGAAFDLRELIGQGGFGEVWVATDVKLKRDVAVKVLREDLVASPALLERFRREAEAAAKLRHPNIVPIYQVGEAEGLVYFVMPLIKGESLRALLEREGRLEVAEAVRILMEAAGALHEAHEAGIVHRDIKPDNILLEGPQRRVLLMDFGIAKSLEVQDGGLTGTGMVIGTPQYMSPEQATGEKHIDARSDIYSLGVVAYQMLAGRLPFEADSAQGMIVAHITAAPDPIETVRTGVPEELAAAVMRALAKKPEVRWPTVAAFAEAIRPPVPVSEESPVRWMTKRLRRSVRGARRRLVWYAGAFVLIVVAVALVDRRAFMGALRFWMSLPRNPSEAALRAPPEQRSSLQLYGGVGWDEVSLTTLGDTLVVALDPRSAPMAFDGTSWRVLPIPGRIAGAPVVLDGALWFFAATRDETVAYVVGREGPVARDTIRADVRRVWSAGRDVLLATADGGMLRGRAGAWRREPTGTRTPLDLFSGDQRRQIGIGVFARGGADSLLIYNGLNWRTIDPRPRIDRYWVYWAAGALPDGTLLVGGEDCERMNDLRNCRALVTRLPPGRDAWLPSDRALPASVRITGMAVRSQQEIWFYGLGAGCPSESCLYRDSAGRIEAQPDFGRSRILAMAFLRDEPIVLTVSGALWTKRGGSWGVLGELPSSINRGVQMSWATTVSPDDPYRWHRWGEATTWATGDGGVRRILDQDTVGGVRRWALTRRGAVVVAACERRWPMTCSAASAVAQSGQHAVTDIALVGGTVVAADGGGRVYRWRGGWEPMAVEGASGDSVIALGTGAGQVMAVVTRNTVLRWDSTASLWRRWLEVPDWVGTPLRIAVHPYGVGAVVLGDRAVAILRPSLPAEPLRGMSGMPTDVAVLDDGRIAVAVPTPDDPLLGGEIFVTTSMDSASVSGRSESTGGRDVYALAYADGLLGMAGSGWGAGSVLMMQLPFADTAARGTLVIGGALPRGAVLFLDESSRTGTSFELRPGRHRLRVQAEGYLPFQRVVFVPGRRTVTVPVALRRQ